MFSRFFIDRPIFASVLSIVDHAGGRHRACRRCRSRSIPRSRRRRSRSRPYYPGRQCPGRRRHRRRADRAAGQRRREHDVHVVAVHQRRHVHADGHLQARRRPEHGPGAGAEPRVAGRADPARPGQAPRRDGQEEVAQHPDDRQPVLARRQPRQPLPEQLRDDPASRTSWRGSTASATSPTSASATTACGSGSTRRRCRSANLDRRRRGRARSSSRTRRSPPARSASRRSPSGQVFQFTITHARAGSSIAEQFADMILKTDAAGPARPRSRDVGPDRAGARATTRPARSTASPRWPCRSISCPGSNALETAGLVRDKMEELQGPLSRRASTTPSSTTRRRSSTSRSTRCSRPCATPSSWWPSSCWCSCRTGGRRSSR